MDTNIHYLRLLTICAPLAISMHLYDPFNTVVTNILSICNTCLESALFLSRVQGVFFILILILLISWWCNIYNFFKRLRGYQVVFFLYDIEIYSSTALIFAPLPEFVNRRVSLNFMVIRLNIDPVQFLTVLLFRLAEVVYKTQMR